MYLLESLYTWTGPEEQHGAQTTIERASGLKSRTPGLEWKLWVSDLASRTRGGYYLFDTEENARAFEAQTLVSLSENEHARDPRTRLFAVRDDVSALTGALGPNR